jgi:hypothetical protein
MVTYGRRAGVPGDPRRWAPHDFGDGEQRNREAEAQQRDQLGSTDGRSVLA